MKNRHPFDQDWKPLQPKRQRDRNDKHDKHKSWQTTVLAPLIAAATIQKKCFEPAVYHIKSI